MTEEQLKKLLDAQAAQITGYLEGHIDDRLREIHTRLDRQDKRLDDIYNLVDSDTKQRQTDDHERTAMQGQLERHEGWISQLADATGTKLTTD